MSDCGSRQFSEAHLRFPVILLLLLFAPLCALGQLVSYPYPPVPSAQAMGGAFTAAATGVEAVYWNPAGLAYGKGTQTRFAYHNPWALNFLSHLSATVSTALPGLKHGIAAGVQTLGTRDGGRSLATETEAFAAHGFMLQQDIHSSLAFGYKLKLIGYSLGQSVANADGVSEDLGSSAVFGLDVGGTAQLWDRFKLGAAFMNINRPQFGGTIAKRDLPRVFTAGVSYLPYYGVQTNFDVERLISGDTQFKGGVSARVVKPLNLRFGVLTNPNLFTAGFGLHYRELVMDYAFIYHPAGLDPSHMIGLGFDLEKTLPELWRAK